jgi:hypothetical protein
MTGGDAARVVPLEIAVAREEVLRALGYPAGHQPPAGTMDRLLRLWPHAEGLLEPRGAYRIVAQDAARAAGMPQAETRVAIAVCTIGPGVEKAVAAAGAGGRLLDALLLDAFGSAAAEAAADALNARVCDAARRRRLFAAARVSPGYGAWETAGQRQLLALLPVGELGITLTSGQMMVPRKSVSFAANLVNARPTWSETPCVRCGLPRCRHRMAAAG